MKQLEDIIQRKAAKLVIVDPVMTFLPDRVNSFRDQDVRRARTRQRSSRMSNQRWKRAERASARLLGTTRIPNNGTGQPDMIAGRLAVEHKLRTALPAWLTEAVDQAARNAGAGQIPAVIFAIPKRGVGTRRLVVLELTDLLALLATGTEAVSALSVIDAPVM